MNALNSFFKLDKLGTNPKREILAGFTTFISMCYILFVNPTVLSAAGMDKGAVFTATALSSAIGCVLMGVIAKYPIATQKASVLRILLPCPLAACFQEWKKT